jgi:hypothetical protein
MFQLHSNQLLFYAKIVNLLANLDRTQADLIVAIVSYIETLHRIQAVQTNAYIINTVGQICRHDQL